jgi:hypothetical protein
MEDVSQHFMGGLSALDEVADALTPDKAVETLDETSLQLFWRDWPHISSWAGALWRRLSEDLSGPAAPSEDGDFEDTGGGD